MYAEQGKTSLPPVFLSSISVFALGGRIPAGVNPSSAAWSATNRMVYVPFTMPQTAVVYRYFWANGATASTNNLQVAVYTTAFSRVNVGTSTLSSGANVCQFDNITDYVLPAGNYYMALWCSGTTATVLRTASGAVGPGVYYETHASGPQATGTPADPGVQTPVVPLFGLALRATDP